MLCVAFFQRRDAEAAEGTVRLEMPEVALRVAFFQRRDAEAAERRREYVEA